jgi:hypothetical protein
LLIISAWIAIFLLDHCCLGHSKQNPELVTPTIQLKPSNALTVYFNIAGGAAVEAYEPAAGVMSPHHDDKERAYDADSEENYVEHSETESEEGSATETLCTEDVPADSGMEEEASADEQSADMSADSATHESEADGSGTDQSEGNDSATDDSEEGNPEAEQAAELSDPSCVPLSADAHRQGHRYLSSPASARTSITRINSSTSNNNNTSSSSSSSSDQVQPAIGQSSKPTNMSVSARMFQNCSTVTYNTSATQLSNTTCRNQQPATAQRQQQQQQQQQQTKRQSQSVWRDNGRVRNFTAAATPLQVSSTKLLETTSPLSTKAVAGAAVAAVCSSDSMPAAAALMMTRTLRVVARMAEQAGSKRLQPQHGNSNAQKQCQKQACCDVQRVHSNYEQLQQLKLPNMQQQQQQHYQQQQQQQSEHQLQAMHHSHVLNSSSSNNSSRRLSQFTTSQRGPGGQQEAAVANAAAAAALSDSPFNYHPCHNPVALATRPSSSAMDRPAAPPSPPALASAVEATGHSAALRVVHESSGPATPYDPELLSNSSRQQNSQQMVATDCYSAAPPTNQPYAMITVSNLDLKAPAAAAAALSQSAPAAYTDNPPSSDQQQQPQLHQQQQEPDEVDEPTQLCRSTHGSFASDTTAGQHWKMSSSSSSSNSLQGLQCLFDASADSISRPAAALDIMGSIGPCAASAAEVTALPAAAAEGPFPCPLHASNFFTDWAESNGGSSSSSILQGSKGDLLGVGANNSCSMHMDRHLEEGCLQLQEHDSITAATPAARAPTAPTAGAAVPDIMTPQDTDIGSALTGGMQSPEEAQQAAGAAAAAAAARTTGSGSSRGCNQSITKMLNAAEACGADDGRCTSHGHAVLLTETPPGDHNNQHQQQQEHQQQQQQQEKETHAENDNEQLLREGDPTRPPQLRTLQQQRVEEAQCQQQDSSDQPLRQHLLLPQPQPQPVQHPVLTAGLGFTLVTSVMSQHPATSVTRNVLLSQLHQLEQQAEQLSNVIQVDDDLATAAAGWRNKVNEMSVSLVSSNAPVGLGSTATRPELSVNSRGSLVGKVVKGRKAVATCKLTLSSSSLAAAAPPVVAAPSVTSAQHSHAGKGLSHHRAGQAYPAAPGKATVGKPQQQPASLPVRSRAAAAEAANVVTVGSFTTAGPADMQDVWL